MDHEMEDTVNAVVAAMQENDNQQEQNYDSSENASEPAAKRNFSDHIQHSTNDASPQQQSTAASKTIAIDDDDDDENYNYQEEPSSQQLRFILQKQHSLILEQQQGMASLAQRMYQMEQMFQTSQERATTMIHTELQRFLQTNDTARTNFALDALLERMATHQPYCPFQTPSPLMNASEMAVHQEEENVYESMKHAYQRNAPGCLAMAVAWNEEAKLRYIAKLRRRPNGKLDSNSTTRNTNHAKEANQKQSSNIYDSNENESTDQNDDSTRKEEEEEKNNNNIKLIYRKSFRHMCEKHMGSSNSEAAAASIMTMPMTMMAASQLQPQFTMPMPTVTMETAIAAANDAVAAATRYNNTNPIPIAPKPPTKSTTNQNRKTTIVNNKDQPSPSKRVNPPRNAKKSSPATTPNKTKTTPSAVAGSAAENKQTHQSQQPKAPPKRGQQQPEKKQPPTPVQDQKPSATQRTSQASQPQQTDQSKKSTSQAQAQQPLDPKTTLEQAHHQQQMHHAQQASLIPVASPTTYPPPSHPPTMYPAPYAVAYPTPFFGPYYPSAFPPQMYGHIPPQPPPQPGDAPPGMVFNSWHYCIVCGFPKKDHHEEDETPGEGCKRNYCGNCNEMKHFHTPADGFGRYCRKPHNPTRCFFKKNWFKPSRPFRKKKPQVGETPPRENGAKSSNSDMDTDDDTKPQEFTPTHPPPGHCYRSGIFCLTCGLRKVGNHEGKQYHDKCTVEICGNCDWKKDRHKPEHGFGPTCTRPTKSWVDRMDWFGEQRTQRKRKSEE